MLAGTIRNRASSRTLLAQCRNSLLISSRLQQPQQPQYDLILPVLSNQFHSFPHSHSQVISWPLLHHSVFNSVFKQVGYSSSASPEPNEKEKEAGGQGNTVEDIDGAAKSSEDAEVSGKMQTSSGIKDESGSNTDPSSRVSQSAKRTRRNTKRIAFSDSDSDSDLVDDTSKDDLMRLLKEKKKEIRTKEKEIKEIQDKALRTCAEMQNVMDRTKREAENSKKFAVQSFAKSLLDVADNLGRASSVVKDSFSKINATEDSVGAVPLLKTLLEGVEMTEKQLAEVFRKFGLEKYDPTNEPFDPNRHNAVFQVPDPSKPPGTVAVVLKSGYMLHDRVVRPAEVGVTVEVNQQPDQENN